MVKANMIIAPKAITIRNIPKKTDVTTRFSPAIIKGAIKIRLITEIIPTVNKVPVNPCLAREKRKIPSIEVAIRREIHSPSKVAISGPRLIAIANEIKVDSKQNKSIKLYLKNNLMPAWEDWNLLLLRSCFLLKIFPRIFLML
jgi:hypothetical protein